MPDTTEYIALTDVPETRPWLKAPWLRDQVYHGTLRHFKVGRLIYFDTKDLDALLVEVPATRPMATSLR